MKKQEELTWVLKGDEQTAAAAWHRAQNQLTRVLKDQSESSQWAITNIPKGGRERKI